MRNLDTEKQPIVQRNWWEVEEKNNPHTRQATRERIQNITKFLLQSTATYHNAHKATKPLHIQRIKMETSNAGGWFFVIKVGIEGGNKRGEKRNNGGKQ